MERRAFIVMTLAAAGWPLAGRAQPKAMPVIGWLSALSPSIQGGSRMPELGTYDTGSSLAAFREGLKETGTSRDKM
jgi:hypothetical protein